MATETLDSAGEKDLCRLATVFSTSTRQRIIRLLASGSSYTFTEILNHLKTFDENVRSNNLSYHLKELGDLIEQGVRAEYRITPKGLYVKEILDDLEATPKVCEEPAIEMQGRSMSMGVEKVVMGGMLVRVTPNNFVKLVGQRGGLVIHSKIGTFRARELYLSCIDGMNVYCKSKKAIDGLEQVSEALRVEIPKNMIIDI